MFIEKDPEFMKGFLKYLEENKRINQKEKQKLLILNNTRLFKEES
jgi:hypothetical protein